MIRITTTTRELAEKINKHLDGVHTFNYDDDYLDIADCRKLGRNAPMRIFLEDGELKPSPLTVKRDKEKMDLLEQVKNLALKDIDINYDSNERY